MFYEAQTTWEKVKSDHFWELSNELVEAVEIIFAFLRDTDSETAGCAGGYALAA